MDIPDAATTSTPPPQESQDDNQDLVKQVTEKVKTISQNKPFVDLVIERRFPDSIIDTLKSKGYVVNIYEFYDSSTDKRQSRIKIKNPNFENAAVNFFEEIERKCRDFGFSAETVQLSDNLTNADVFSKMAQMANFFRDA